MSRRRHGETASATILHFQPRQRDAVGTAPRGRTPGLRTSESEPLTEAPAFTGLFPFQISHPIVFINTRVLVRSAVLAFGSENMVPVITGLPRARE